MNWKNSWEVQPLEPGLYVTRLVGDGSDFQYWNGKYWGRPALTKQDAINKKDIESLVQDIQWRPLIA